MPRAQTPPPKQRIHRPLPRNPTSALLTPDEFADEVRLSRQTIRTWLMQGRIHSRKIGGARRIERAELERFINEGPLEPGAA